MIPRRAAQVERENGSGTLKVQRPEQVPLVRAGKYTRAPELTVTADAKPVVLVSRSVPSLTAVAPV